MKFLLLVGGFKPFENILVKLGLFAQVGVKIINAWNHHLVLDWVIFRFKIFMFRGCTLQRLKQDP